MSMERLEQQQSYQQAPHSEGVLTPVRAYTPMQAYFLLRLGRLVTLHESLNKQQDQQKDPVLIKALRHAIFSTYCDSADLGAGEEGRRILNRENSGY